MSKKQADLITTAEAAEVLGVQPFRVLELQKERGFQTVRRTGINSKLFKRADIEAYKRQRDEWLAHRNNGGPKLNRKVKGKGKDKSKSKDKSKGDTGLTMDQTSLETTIQPKAPMA
jgi:hypothetical protein